MFNLLPDNLRKEIKKEYFLRRIVVILLFAIFTQIVFIIFIAPTWLTSKYKEQDMINQSIDMERYLSSINVASTTSNIKSINAELLVIDKALRYPEVVPFVNNILSKKTNSIYITDILYTSKNDKVASISVHGISATRESLTTFVKNLQTTGLFKSVDLPISNFAKDKNLNFSLDLKIEQP